jgi:hypothetical protein
MKKLLGFCLLFCSVCFSCFNPTLEDAALMPAGEEEDGDLYDGADGPVNFSSFTLDAETGLPADDPAANGAGVAIATLTAPEKEGHWTPELDADVEDNGLFEIAGVSAGQFEIRIKDEPLPVGPYKVVLNIRNGAGKVYHWTIEFSVARTPPPFKNAPLVYPYITGVGRNKLTVQWDELPRSAKWYQIYVGTSANSADARPYGERVSITDAQNTAEITDIEGDEADGYLPDGITYYVWLKPGNNEGEGAFSSYGKRKTSDTMPDFFWLDEKGGGFYCWDSFYGGSGSPTGDYYIVTPPSEEYPGGRLKYGPGANSQWDIVYFRFDNGAGKGKWGEDLSGTKAGDFIVKYPKSRGSGEHGERIYQMVMFWGMGAIQTKGPADGNSLGPNGNPLGLTLCYFSNAWDLTYKRNPETETLEQAFDKFFDSKMGARNYNSYVATPWYRDYKTDRSVAPWY